MTLVLLDEDTRLAIATYLAEREMAGDATQYHGEVKVAAFGGTYRVRCSHNWRSDPLDLRIQEVIVRGEKRIPFYIARCEAGVVHYATCV